MSRSPPQDLKNGWISKLTIQYWWASALYYQWIVSSNTSEWTCEQTPERIIRLPSSNSSAPSQLCPKYSGSIFKTQWQPSSIVSGNTNTKLTLSFQSSKYHRCSHDATHSQFLGGVRLILMAASSQVCSRTSTRIIMTMMIIQRVSLSLNALQE